MACQITFLGLINFFDVTAQGGLILLPEGREFGDGIADHFARFYVPADGVIDEDTDWWPEFIDADMANIGVRSFPIEAASKITINALDPVNGEQVQAAQNITFIPSLNDVLQIEPQSAITIAQIPFGRGSLEAFLLIEAAVSVLRVDAHDAVIRITATHADGEKKLAVRNNTEIVLANMSDLSAIAPEANTPSHYSIYSRLEGTHKSIPDPVINAQLGDVTNASGHPLVQFIRDNFGHVPRGGCSGSQYSSTAVASSVGGQ
jgi:hypothetical protein